MRERLESEDARRRWRQNVENVGFRISGAASREKQTVERAGQTAALEQA